MKRPDIKELINRLREQHYWGKILVEAADALEHLDNCLFGLDSVALALSRHLKSQDKMVDEMRARIAELEAALKPFSNSQHLDGLPVWTDDGAIIGCNFQVHDLRAARAALKGERV